MRASPGPEPWEPDAANSLRASQTAGGKSADKANAGKSQADYIQDAQSAYNKAQTALKKGDWAEYGKQMKVLENSLNALK